MFLAAGLRKILELGISDGRGMWEYSTTDLHTAVDESGYFAGVNAPGANVGMKVGDIVLVRRTSDGAVTLHSVTAIAANGNATISSAVLA